MRLAPMPKSRHSKYFFRPQQEICLQSLLILHMQMPVKEHGPRSVNAHSVICAFVFLTNRDSPTSSCILARIRPVKIAPWSHSTLPAARCPHRVPVCMSSWLSQYIGARFPTSASYFLRLLLLHPTLKTASPIFVYWIPEHLPCLMLLCSL